MRQRSSRRQKISQRQRFFDLLSFGVPLQIPASFYCVCLWIYNCITPRLTGTLTSASFSPRPASPPEWPPAHTKPAARPGHDQRAMALFGPGPYRAHLRPGWSFGPWADRHMPAAGVRPTAPTVSTPAAKRQSRAERQYPGPPASPVILDRTVRPPTDSDARAGGRPERPRFRQRRRGRRRLPTGAHTAD